MKRQLLVALWLLYGLASAQAQISGSLSVCTGSTTGLTHGTPDGTWRSGNISVATVDSTLGIVSGIAAGTASISYMMGASLVDEAVVTVNSLPAVISGPSLVCIGSNISLVSAPSGGSWSSSNTDIVTVTAHPSIGGRGIVTGVGTGSAVITYTNANGCYQTHAVTVPAVLSTPTTSLLDFYVCEGSSIAIMNATPYGTWSTSSDYVAQFLNPYIGTITGGHADGANREIIVSYVATVEDTQRCAIHTFTVTPLVKVIYVTEVCVGNSITFVPDSLGGTWSSSNPDSLSIDAYGTATGLIATEGGGQITYQMTNYPNCMNNKATSSPTIKVKGPLSISGSLAVCIGETTTLSGGFSGSWSSSNTAIGTIGASSGVLGGISAGTTTISFIKALSPACYTSAVATVNGAPEDITGTLSVCPGGTTVLSSATGGGTWSSSNTSVATVGSSSGIVSGVAIGSVTITYTAPTGCITTATVTVGAGPFAAPSYEAVVCTTGTLRLYANDIGTNSYAWTGPSSFSSTLQNPTRPSATTAMNGTYTLVVTSLTTGCSATYTVNATVLTTSPYTVSVTQTAPFTLTGERIHTYGSGFTLRADASVTLPGTGVTYSWSGPITGATQTFSPTFTSTTTVTTKNYTVTVSYNGCSASVKDTIVVPATGCSPYNYFSVNNYRTLKSLPTLGSCSDCNEVKPFHTINTWNLSSLVDGENYYLAFNQPMYLYKTEYANNNIFINAGGVLVVDSPYSVTLNHCHLASPCNWVGVVVRQGVNTTGHLRTINNTLIEDAYGGTYEGIAKSAIILWKTPGSGGYYSPGMADVLESNGTIFNKNGAGINIQDYKPSIAARPGGSRLPFTIKNNVFSRVELARNDTGATAAENYPFAWPTTAMLKTVVSVDTVPKYGVDNYRTVALTCGGINLNNVGNKNQLTSGTTDTPATYEFSYIHLGVDNADTYFDSTNLFDSLHIAISVNNSNAKLFNNSFRNITNMAVQAVGTYNGLRLEGDSAAHTNNRFYNCSQSIRTDGSGTVDYWDITCRNTVFKSVLGVPGMVALCGAFFGNLTGAHGVYDFSHNNMFNNGMAQINAGNTTIKKGFSFFCNNIMTGRTTWTGPNSMTYAIYVNDYANSSTNGTIIIDSNTITGAALGVYGVNVLQRLFVRNNNITLYPYDNPQGNIIAGVYLYIAPGVKEVKYNTISGQGYKCYSTSGPYSTGMRLRAIGSSTSTADVSCNLVQDIGYAFNFVGTSYVSWRKNEMRRDYTGIILDPSTTIGNQGSACDPSDNTWTGDACTGGSCTDCDDFPGWGASGSVHATYTVGMTPTTSKLYVRPGAPFQPTTNSNSGGGAAYVLASTILTVNVTTCGTPDYSSCIIEEVAERGIARNNGEQVQTLASGTMTIFPNPAQNGVTVEVSDAADATADVKIVNAVGAEVYHATHTFNYSRISLDLQQLAPGMYIVHLHTSKGTVNTGRIVIVK